MSSLPLGYSDYNEKPTNNGNNNNKPYLNQLNRQNRAQRNINNKKVENMKNYIKKSQQSSDSDDEDDNYDNFNPPSYPTSIGTQKREERDNGPQLPQISENYENILRDMQSDGNLQNNDSEGDAPITKETFNQLTGGFASQNQSYVPYYTNMSQVENSSNKEVLQKLNYLITLIETQSDEKINSVTEELVLYGFLGIFIIYVLDSFAKAGKYVR